MNPRHTDANVESAADVAKRAASFIIDLENVYSGKNILLVSHGDLLQILQTYFENRSPTDHRNINHFMVAEVRKMNNVYN